MASYSDVLLGEHPAMVEVRRLIDKVAKSPTRTVLIYGETGTGKGLVARILHRMSPRRTNEFVDINCAAIPSSLMESELFGHERGAFTGAVARKTGLVEAANGGTVFLDEVRELDPTLQAKLLSLLDTQSFRRVGATAPTSVDVRFVAATNRILLREVEAGKFRQDLYYRLQVIAINIPPLRERGDDLFYLADHFLGQLAATYGRKVSGFHPEAAAMLKRYAWPGNVRELEHLLERIVLLEEEDEILPRHLPPRILRTVGEARQADAGDGAPPPAGFRAATDAFQRQLIAAAIAASDGNTRHAAERLGLTRHALRHQINRLGLR
jgi:transcriptional regulator with PAS, ATPase and Fis domain